jgi:hypothetical protein
VDIDFFTWEIKEPVRSRPVAGGLCGLVTGFLFGLAAGQANAASVTSITIAYTAAGGLAGVLIGSLLPLFRNRLWAGVVVSVAATVALLIIHRFAGQYLPPEASVFFGCATGFAYAMLFWKYSR